MNYLKKISAARLLRRQTELKPLSGAVLVFAFAFPAFAGTIWDAGGGANTDINTAANWDSDTLPDLTGGAAVVTFATGGGTATINTNVNFAGININRDANFAIADGAGTLTLGTSGIAVTLPTVTGRTHTISETVVLGGDQIWSVVNNTGNAILTVSGVIDDGGTGYGITKNGSGRLSLIGSAKTYSGGTVLNGGALQINNSNQLGDDVVGNSLTINNAASFSGNNGTVLSGANRTIILGAGGGGFLTGGAGQTFTVAIPITGATGSSHLLKYSPGIVILTNGSNTYTGNTQINNDTLALAGGNDRLPTSTSVTVGTGSNTAYLRLDGVSQTVAGLNRGGTSTAYVIGGSATTSTITVNRTSGSSTYDGFLGGVASNANNLNFAKTGAGTFTLSGANTYTGTTTISQGVLIADSIVVSGGNSNLGNAASAVVLGDASNQGTLQYSGGAATYTRGFTVNAGGGQLTNAGGALLTVATGGVAASGQFTVNGAAGNDVAISSVISGAGGLTKTGDHTLTLSGLSTYSGATNVNQGTLELARTAGINTINAASAITVANGATLSTTAASNNTQTVNALLTLNGGTLAAGGGSVTTNHQNFSFSTNGAIIAGNNAVSTISAGLSLNGRDIYNNTGGFTKITVDANSTLEISGIIRPVVSTSWGGISKYGAGTLKLTSGNNLYYEGMYLTAGTVEFTSGSLSRRHNSATNLGYAADFEGNATLRWAAGNTEDVSTGAGGYSTSQIKIADGVTATFDTNGNNVNFATAFTLGGSQTGALKKSGAGTLTLAAANSYSGTTTVSGGTLSLGTTGSLNNSNVVVQSGAAFAGTGGVKSLNVQVGGFHRPGNSPGITTVNGDYSLAGTLVIEIDGLAGPGLVGGHDQVVVNNDGNGSLVTLSGTLAVVPVWGLSVNDSFTIIDNNGGSAINGVFYGLAEGASFRSGDYFFTISYLGGVGNDVVLTVNEVIFVPEPTTSLLACGVLGIAAWRRRRFNWGAAAPERGDPRCSGI